MKRLGLAVFFATSICTAYSADPAIPGFDEWVHQVKLPTPEIEKLPNGLTLAWYPDGRLPILELVAMVQAGSMRDKMGKSGTASLLGSLLDRGSGGMGSSEWLQHLSDLGASHSISADDETTTVSVRGLSGDSDVLLKYLSEMLLKPDLTQKEFDRSKKLTLDQWRHLGDNSSSLSAMAFYRWITQGTDYARGAMGSLDELKKIDRKDVVDFHRTSFLPQATILVVVGRVDKGKFRERLVKEFGSWSAPKVPSKVAKSAVLPKAKFPSIPSSLGGVLIERKGASQAQVLMGMPSVLYRHPDHYALIVANALLGEYFGSRLNTVVRDQLGLTYSIASSFTYFRDYAFFSIQSSTRNETVGKLIQEIRKQMELLATKGVTDTEVEEAKRYLLGQFPVKMSSVGSVASRWLGGYVYDLGPDYLNELIPKVHAVTAAQVNAAVKKHLAPKNVRVVVSGDTAELQKQLKKSGLKPFKALTEKDLL